MRKKASKPRIRVAGFDIASMNSGVCVIEACTQAGHPPLEYQTLGELAYRNYDKTFEARVQAAIDMVEFVKKHNCDLVVVEDYIRSLGRGNTTAYEHAELAGLVKYFLYQMEIPMLLVSPSTMRSFVGVAPKQDKGVIIDRAHELFGFASKAPRKGERSNVVDSFLHAYIGACVFYAREGHLTSQLGPKERKVIYGDSKKMIGLLNRDLILRREHGEEES